MCGVIPHCVTDGHTCLVTLNPNQQINVVKAKEVWQDGHRRPSIVSIPSGWVGENRLVCMLSRICTRPHSPTTRGGRIIHTTRTHSLSKKLTVHANGLLRVFRCRPLYIIQVRRIWKDCCVLRFWCYLWCIDSYRGKLKMLSPFFVINTTVSERSGGKRWGWCAYRCIKAIWHSLPWNAHTCWRFCGFALKLIFCGRLLGRPIEHQDRPLAEFHEHQQNCHGAISHELLNYRIVLGGDPILIGRHNIPLLGAPSQHKTSFFKIHFLHSPSIRWWAHDASVVDAFNTFGWRNVSWNCS